MERITSFDEHYKGSKHKKEALGIVDEFIGLHTAKAQYEELSIKAVEILKDLRANIELHWGK